MKMAKASEEEMERSIVLSGMLLDVDGGDFPRGINGERDENDPDYFDVDDPEHLRAFHDRIMGTMAGIHRVTWGFHTLMHNDIVDPDLDVLELHPRIVAALATVEEKKPVPEDQRSIAEQLAATPGRIEYCSALTDLPVELWQVGDIVSRDGNDEQEIVSFNDARDLIEVKCIKEPPVYEGGTEPWCRLGDLENNLTRRYSFVRPGKRDAPWEPIGPEKEEEARRIELALGLRTE